ncbi:MAG: 30S ribosomal protein S12 methylthiotransferase RimO [Candidatus Omnitrophica bacterium]|nr:30S ribosomal protein S12 methylthiotransferase RimO [Candidatus Omnitrophota bacterium]
MKIHVISLGCARALVDSEGLAGLLAESGHSLTDEIKKAEVVVINTCAFIRDAEEESVNTILEAAELKKTGRLRRLYVAGCLPQKRRSEKEDLLKLLPEVDGFIGTGDLPRLPQLIQEEKNRFFVASPVPTLLFESTAPRRRLTPKHFAYLKISEGCDHACTFCSIPQYRGAHRSRSMEDIVTQAENLAGQGVVELNLIGQDTSYYGTDRYGTPCLPALLERLGQVTGIRWIRILYAHPAHVTDELIRAIRDVSSVAHYIDVPIQHINDGILSRMRRETNGRNIRRMIDRFRRQIPDIAIRTTFIAGFPGETQADVDELAAFMKEVRFERVGIFPYSPEPKTPSEKMAGQIPEDIKKERLNRLMLLQQEISQEINRSWIGREVEVLIDEPDASDPKTYIGRTYADAPEVDGQVFVKSAGYLKPGRFVRARVTDSYEYDLVAEAAE